MPITVDKEFPYAFLTDLSNHGKYILLFRSEKFTLLDRFHIVEWNGDILLCPTPDVELNNGKEPYRILQDGDIISVTSKDQENENNILEKVFVIHIPTRPL